MFQDDEDLTFRSSSLITTWKLIKFEEIQTDSLPKTSIVKLCATFTCALCTAALVQNQCTAIPGGYSFTNGQSYSAFSIYYPIFSTLT